MKTEQIKDILFEHLDNTDEHSNTSFKLFGFEFHLSKWDYTYNIMANNHKPYDYEVSTNRYLYDDVLEDFIDFIKNIPFL